MGGQKQDLQSDLLKQECVHHQLDFRLGFKILKVHLLKLK